MSNGPLSFPFRIGPDGVAATVGKGTDAEVDEAIGVLALTHLGERPMEPRFGVPDPAFAGLNTGDIQVGLDMFGPTGITVVSVETTPVTDTYSKATIAWQRTDDQGFDS